MSEETLFTDPVTGGQKGAKPERFDLVPSYPMRNVARVYGFGATKYAPHNWMKGYPWSLSIAALERHLNWFKEREDDDPESGLDHLAHVVFHALALMWFRRFRPELDDRPPKVEKPNA